MKIIPAIKTKLLQREYILSSLITSKQKSYSLFLMVSILISPYEPKIEYFIRD